MDAMDLYKALFQADLTWYSSLVRILISFLFGCVLGIERKKRHQFVGIRTLMLICVSSSLLMLLSIYTGTQLPNSTGDPSRIAAQVVSGIGFLGAGTIMLQGLNIKGLTSSAIIWSAAAIGMAVGAGFIIPATATLLLLVSAIVIIEKVEDKFFPSGRAKKLNLSFMNKRVDVEAITSILTTNGLLVINTDVSRDFLKKHIVISFFVRVPPAIDIFDIIDKIKNTGKLEEFSLTD